MTAEKMFGFVALVVLLAFTVKILLSFVGGLRERRQRQQSESSDLPPTVGS